MPEVTLKVEGSDFRGWENVQIKRGLNTLAGTFSLKVSNPWAPDEANWPIKVGKLCDILIDGEKVISGYIDAVSSSFNENSHDINIVGRDRAGDLIDSSITNIDQLTQVTFATVCREICKPFNIEVIDSVNLSDKIPIFKTQPSESAFEAINRHAKLFGVLVASNGQGAIEIVRSSNQRSATSIRHKLDSPENNNLKSANATFDATGRHNVYTVKSQFSSTLGLMDLEDSLSIEGSAADESIIRHRPLVLIAEAQSTSKTAELRARWEATVRAARSAQISCVLEGWQQENGALWKPNELVRFSSDFLSINQDLLITDVTYTQDLLQGTVVNLVLSRPEAFIPSPVKKFSLELWKQLSDM